jgi:SAM-dependent methyltransferase
MGANDGDEPALDWPGRSRRRPGLGNSAYLILRPLVASLLRARDRYLEPPVRVLDVGCGEMPYYPLFASLASEYVGNDIAPGPGIRFVSPVEELDAPDAAFDLVLCTQVLEHVRRPALALEQLARVLTPGGHLFLTTHGVYPFHPDPADYWRWTQHGFEALFEDVDGLELVELVPHGGPASTVAILFASALRQAGSSLRASGIVRPLIAGVNLVGLVGETLTPRSWRPALAPNFLAVARSDR